RTEIPFRQLLGRTSDAEEGSFDEDAIANLEVRRCRGSLVWPLFFLILSYRFFHLISASALPLFSSWTLSPMEHCLVLPFALFSIVPSFSHSLTTRYDPL